MFPNLLTLTLAASGALCATEVAHVAVADAVKIYAPGNVHTWISLP